MKLIISITLVFIFCSNAGYAQTNSTKKVIDSIQTLIGYSKSERYKTKEKLTYAQRANELAKEFNNDTLYLETNRNLLSHLFNNNDYGGYVHVNHNIIMLSEKLRDSMSLGKAHYAIGYSYYDQKQNDSAYYYYSKAAKIFDGLNNKIQLSYSLGSLSVLQLDGKDYYGADENAIRALNVLEGVSNTNDILDQKWILYNIIGSVASSLKNYDKAIEYHNMALDVAKRMNNDYNNGIYSLNNIAYAKREQKHYNEAIEIFKKITQKKNLFQEDPSFYALILENLAYTQYLTGNYNKKDVITLFERSNAISDSIDDIITKTGTVISMAKFYKGIGETDQAESYAKDAYKLAKDIESNEIYLESMKLLSELKPGDEGKAYLYEYIKVSDSLLNVERDVRNKFARIELETDLLEAENEQISKENLYLVILLIGLFLTAVLIYVLLNQRAKNKELKLRQIQQTANEEIYNLMLSQQDKVDEARTLEKKRISQELHDGILGRLFGTRLSLDGINFNEGKEAVKSRANYIGQLKTIEEDIRKISHELNTDFISGSGFMDIVSELIEHQTQAYELAYTFNYTDDISWDLVSNKTKINIYRIIQESMQNIYKHANASLIDISISLKNSVICLDIIDDGEGFEISKSKKGIGLKNMTSRVNDIEGQISIESQSGKGTVVKVKIPYKN